MDYSQGKLVGVQLSSQKQMKLDLTQTTSSFLLRGSCARRLMTTLYLEAPGEGLNNAFPSTFLLLLSKFRFKFQTVPFVSVITATIQVRTPDPKWHVVSLTLLLLDSSLGNPRGVIC